MVVEDEPRKTEVERETFKRAFLKEERKNDVPWKPSHEAHSKRMEKLEKKEQNLIISLFLNLKYVEFIYI